MYTTFFRTIYYCAAIAVVLGVMTATAIAQPAGPVVGFVQPLVANTGEPSLTLTVTGSGFVAGSVVYWETEALPTTVVSVNQITATVRAGLLDVAGQAGLSVVNPSGTRSTRLIFTVLAAPLSITTTTLPTAQAGIGYSKELEAAGGSVPYVWTTVDALPAGLTLRPAGMLIGTPLTPGSFTFTVRATDAAQRTTVRIFNFSVTASAFGIGTAATLPPAMEGAAYSQVLRAQGGSAPFQWSAGTGLPAGMTIDASSGALSGIPKRRGSYSFFVQVTDSAGRSASATFSLTVQTAPLVITTVSPLFSGIVGSAYSQTFSVSGGVQPYAWTMRPQVSGLALDRTTGILAGTPDQAGAYNLTIQVISDSGITVSKDFTLTVEKPQLLITNSSNLPTGNAGTAYQQRLLATGGKPPYSWSITAGSVQGLMLDASTGILSLASPSAGTFAFGVTVHDSANATSTRLFNLAVAPGLLRLTSTSETLQNSVGNPFVVSLSASGGSSPYVWSANGLPEGLEIDTASGAVSGIFRSAGTFLFTIRVTDAARATATELISVNVTAPTLPDFRVIEMPETADAANQIGTQFQLATPYSLPLNGQLTLSFAPETGVGDPAVQFSTGGRTVDFHIPAGTLQAQFPAASVGLQTGTVAGTITLSARLQTGNITLTPTPITIHSIRVNRTSPVITSATFSRTGLTIEVRVIGYAPSREITQGVFRFRASNGSTLAVSEVNLTLEETFSRWFRDSASTQYGGQFSFAQQFTIQGDVNAVVPVSATLTNRVGRITADIRQ